MNEKEFYYLENETLKVTIQRNGAELYSIYYKPTQTEHLWQGDEKFWAGRAPILFPIVGMLKNGSIHIKDADYAIPKHGIIRKNDTLRVEQNSPRCVRFTLFTDEKTKEVYPYDFVFSLDYVLEESSIALHFTINNKGREKMYFSLGGHPAFRCPVTDEESYTDYHLQFERSEDFLTHRMNADGLLLQAKEEIAKNTSLLPLTENMFDKDALIFTDLQSRKVSLVKNTGEKVLTVDYKDFPHLGLWAKPGAPFICIEPWIGYNDPINATQKIEEKPGMLQLASDETFEAQFSIAIEA